MRQEKRKSPRIGKQLNASVERVATVLLLQEDREVRVTVVDVSREGIGFISPEEFDEDAFIRLSLEVDAFSGGAAHGKKFVTSAVVRNCAQRAVGGFDVKAGYRVGVQVKEQTGRERETWNDLISLWSQKIL